MQCTRFDSILGGRCLAEIPKMEKLVFMKSFDNVILGLDGYLMNFLDDYEGIELLADCLEEQCKTLYLATNDTFRTSEQHLRFFHNKGICSMRCSHIINPEKVITTYCRYNLRKGSIVSLASPELNAQLIKNGLDVVIPPTEHYGLMSEIESFFTPSFKAGAILIDINFNLHISHLTLALQCLKRFPACKILITRYAKWVPLKRDYNVISPFGFVNALRKVTSKTPILLGKRGQFFECLMKKLFKIGKPCRTLFIGENLETDIQFGIECGFQTILLTDNNEVIDTLMSSVIKPQYYIRSITELAELMQKK